jgi:MoaA/NifB/PqqE/SkfB family radical SAM enzyme
VRNGRAPHDEFPNADLGREIMDSPDSPMKALPSVSDKPNDQGHRAHYLGAGSLAPPLEAEDLRQRAAGLDLSPLDRRCVDEMIAALTREGRLPFAWTPQEQHYLTRAAEADVVPYLIYRFKFKVLPERREVTQFPIHVLVEPTSVCNLRCVMCFQTDASFTRKPYMGRMDIGLYRDVIDQAVEGGAGAISIGSRGEPFLHPDIGTMLKYASGRRSVFDLKVITNATRIGEAECHAILSSDVNLVALSIDAHDKSLYEEIRVNGDFDAVLANVRRLRQIRDRHYPKSRVELRVSGVRLREDQDERSFQAFWSEICDTTVFVRVQRRWNTYENPVDPATSHACSFLWDRLYVWYDGTCNPCDEDYKSLLSPGNVKEQTIREIWTSEGMTRMRAAHQAGQRGTLIPCDRCGV